MDFEFNQTPSFEMGSLSDLEELNKALSPGYGTDSASYTGGDALRPESLDASLKTVTFTAQHIKFWKSIPKSKAYSTVEEWNEISAYGSAGTGFMRDGELPQTEDTTYARRTGQVKFLGTTREVTLGMTFIRTAHGDVIARETRNGIIWMLEKMERGLFWGDSTVIAQEFDGVFTQLLTANAGTENIIDLQGANMGQDTVEKATQIVADNYGQPTTMHASLRALSDLGKMMFPKERVGASLRLEDGTIGVAINRFQSEAGLIDLMGNVFLKSDVKPPAAATSSKAPNAPTLGAITTPVTAGTFFNASYDGNYYYKITAVNRFGESATVTSGVVAVASGDGVVIPIVDGGGAEAATGYKVYRCAEGEASTECVFIERIALVAGGTTTYTDINEWIPHCTNALVLQNNNDSLEFKQLSPLIKLPLARISASVRWMQIMAGLPAVFAPKKNVVIKNIGKYTPASVDAT